MTTYALRLKGFTPSTLPLERMSKYLAALADLVGKDLPVHFDKVTKGSAMLKIRIPDELAGDLEARVRHAAIAEHGSDLRRAFDSIDQLARHDKTSAEFKPEKGAVIIQFPGIKKETPRIVSLREYGEINGRIIRLGGKDGTVPVGLQTSSGDIVSCTASLEQAKRLKAFLLEPVEIILRGTGKWTRNADGKWKIDEFKISEFVELSDANFEEELNKAKESHSDWDDVNDFDSELANLRYGD